MRFLHTSDWHLGQTLHDFERHYEHQCFLDWLLTALQQEQADALLIIGDVFDNANPPASAQKQFYRFLQQAKTANPALNILIVGGNHDSAARLEASAPLLEEMGIRVIGQVPRNALGEIDPARLLLPLMRKNGEIGAWCLALPFLRPGDVPRIVHDTVQDKIDETLPAAQEVKTTSDKPASKTPDPYSLGVAELYRQVLRLALEQRQSGQALLATGHCHMVGGEISQDSERNIVIGGTEALSAKVFDARIAYCALGHLHLAQKVGKQAHIRYCGSPIPLSFAEINYRHQVLCIDLDGEKLQQVREIAVPRTVELLRIPLKPAPIDEVLALLAALELPADTPWQAQPYLQVRVLLAAPEPGLRNRIEAALEGKAVRLARIETSSMRQLDGEIQAVSLDDLQKIQPIDIFSRLYQQNFAVEEVPPALLAAFQELQQGELA
jgi:exonuclease SbcD